MVDSRDLGGIRNDRLHGIGVVAALPNIEQRGRHVNCRGGEQVGKEHIKDNTEVTKIVDLILKTPIRTTHRQATIEDVGGIIKLIEPLEADGTLVKRGRELIEREIDYFSVIEHDGVIFGCAALYPFPAQKMAEMACLTVNPEVQAQGDGERILKHMENRARAAGLNKLFVLTTRTSHWFKKRGFVPATVDDLPKDRQHMYNWQRKSQVLIKTL